MQGVKKRFVLVVAHLLKEVIEELLDDIDKVLKESGLFICSGMIERDTRRVMSKMKRLDF